MNQQTKLSDLDEALETLCKLGIYEPANKVEPDAEERPYLAVQKTCRERN
jgi:hypothetical protein